MNKFTVVLTYVGRTQSRHEIQAKDREAALDQARKFGNMYNAVGADIA